MTGVAFAALIQRSIRGMKPRFALAKETTGGSTTPATPVDTFYDRHLSQMKRWARQLAEPGANLEDFVHDIFLVAEFLTGAMVGAVVGWSWKDRSSGPLLKAEPPAKTTLKLVREQSISAPAKAHSAEQPEVPIQHLETVGRQAHGARDWHFRQGRGARRSPGPWGQGRG